MRAADEAGLDTVWVVDHLIQADPMSMPDSEMLEAYTTLGLLAAHTRRVRLGTMVTAVTYRPPAMVIKAVTTLDALSGGRAWLGVGAGYLEQEARAMDVPLPLVSERFERLEETLRLALHMWTGDPSPFEGRHYHVERPVTNPPPLQQPPPILIGGMGERKRCVLWRRMRMPATCSTSPTKARRSGTSWTSSRDTATPPAATTTRSRRPLACG